MAEHDEGLATLRIAVDLLLAIGGAGVAGVTVSEVCRQTGYPQRTVYRHLKSLRELGLAEPAGSRGVYRLGPVVESLAVRTSRQREFLERSVDYVDVLADQTGLLVHCTVLDQGSVVTVAVAQGANAVDQKGPRVVVGSRRPAHASASGKLFLAYSPTALEAYLARPLTALTRRTITDPNQLRRESLDIARKGYATDRHEYEMGICCVAVPVWGAARRVIGGMSISWPEKEGEFNIAHNQLSLLQDAASAFSKSIGGERIE